ncbi:MAG TPA: SRPBCC family protein [Candidatus Dormibacteraeota bacterium]|nr:SRPBCC family protein [Candidatus Dormibacteraeota bacterium]
MSSSVTAATVRKEIVVEAPVDRAFRVFVEQFDKIKPHEHNLMAVDVADTVFEPRAGGYIYDRGVDGSSCRFARVLTYEPPRLIVFTWDISPHWALETDHAKTSEVEVRFTPESAGRTRVVLEHRNLDRHGDDWQAMRDGVEKANGWPLYLERFAKLLKP